VSAGPLAGVRVVELAGIGPGPFAAMLLADLGADVVRVDRTGPVDEGWARADVVNRGKRSVAVDLKHPDGPGVVRALARRADAVVDPYRPGVAERLGIGPDDLLAANPRLVYARMTGWGQHGPLADRAGHDIDYIAMSGVLAHIGLAGQRPTPPLNLVGDFGGGTMFLVSGILAGLLNVARGGSGQVVDVAMVDGSALLMAPLYAAHATGFWSSERGANLLDSGVPWYDTYECADGRHVAVGALEPPFYAALLAALGLDGEELPDRGDRESWPELRRRFADVFATRTRDEWAETFLPTDACVAPVLTMGEAPAHPLATERSSFVEVGGLPSPAPAPRFSATPAAVDSPPVQPGTTSREVLADAGFSAAEVAALVASGAVVVAAG